MEVDVVRGALMVGLIGCGPTEFKTTVDPEDVPAVGWGATFQSRFHGIEGTVTIIEAEDLDGQPLLELAFQHFKYDGGGSDEVWLKLVIEDGDYRLGHKVGQNLAGTPYDNAMFSMPIPEDAPFSSWNVIAVYDTVEEETFGDGVFGPDGEPFDTGFF